jgi:hypothetical protein
MKRKLKPVKVVERKLGRERANGQYWRGKRLIEIDGRLKPQKYLKILCHEILHHINEDASESRVERESGVLAGILWQEGYRKVIGV